MEHVYIVIATKDSDIETCEAFDGIEKALGRAFQLSSDKSGSGRPDLFNPSPKEELLEDGSLRWTFMNTNKQSVIVNYRKIDQALRSTKDIMNFAGFGVVGATGPTGPCGSIVGHFNVGVTGISAPVNLEHNMGGGSAFPLKDSSLKNVPLYNFTDSSLPAGWKVDGSPAFMSDMIYDACNVVDPLYFTEKQKWALVTARVRKSPKFNNGYSRLEQPDILIELKKKSDLGKAIRDMEISTLREYYLDFCDDHADL